MHIAPQTTRSLHRTLTTRACSGAGMARTLHATIRNPQSAIALGSAVLLLALLTGCSQFDLADKFAFPGEKPKPPERLTALWTHTVLNQPGKPGVRGFGGRVMFYGKDRDKSINVDGSLTIYAYDDTHSDGSRSAPVRKYVFTADQLPDHYSKSALGPSFSVWLPWDEVGGSQRQIGLLARFEGRKGGVVMSDMSRQTLPGIGLEPAPQVATSQKSANQKTTAVAPGGIQQVTHTTNQGAVSDVAPAVAVGAPSSATEAPAMSTSTIAVPPSFARRALSAIDQSGSRITEQQRQLEATARLAAAIEESAAVENSGRDDTGQRVEHGARALSQTRDDSAEESAEHSTERAAVRSLASAGQEATGQAGTVKGATSARFARAKFPARAQPRVPPKADLVRRRPHPAGWPSGLSPTPRLDHAGGSRVTGAVEESATEPANPAAER